MKKINEGPDFMIGMENNSNLEYGHVVGTASPPLNEEKDFLKKNIKSLTNFFIKKGYIIKPLPKVRLDHTKQNGLFIKTGYYSPSEKEIVLFVDGRHPKDILRSFSHELIHHIQNLRGDSLNFNDKDCVYNNSDLEKLEGEAYLKGNILFRKWTEETTSVLSEGKMLFEPNQFSIKKNLNPKFWENESLKPEIRLRLLEIADDFIKTLEIKEKPIDITITGSLSNYNWNGRFSDVDLHILYDFKKINKDTDFCRNYFNAMKKMWNSSHSKLKIYGFPVELSVQDVNESHISTGVYSLNKNEWSKKPGQIQNPKSDIDNDSIEGKLKDIVEEIDNLELALNSIDTMDDFKARKINKEANTLFRKIKKIRKKGLDSKKSEMSDGNLIFKTLRRKGFIKKLAKIKDKSYDFMMSL